MMIEFLKNVADGALYFCLTVVCLAIAARLTAWFLSVATNTFYEMREDWFSHRNRMKIYKDMSK
jgi:hypothetical protein